VSTVTSADGTTIDYDAYGSGPIGLPAEAVDEMAQTPWWPGLVAVAPTLVYDHKASHDIETGPDWRSRWADRFVAGR
jgi:hypothetical protein